PTASPLPLRPPPRSTLFPYTTLFRSTEDDVRARRIGFGVRPWVKKIDTLAAEFPADTNYLYTTYNATSHDVTFDDHGTIILGSGDRKSTRLNSSHVKISYAVFCLKKK